MLHFLYLDTCVCIKPFSYLSCTPKDRISNTGRVIYSFFESLSTLGRLIFNFYLK